MNIIRNMDMNEFSLFIVPLLAIGGMLVLYLVLLLWRK